MITTSSSSRNNPAVTETSPMGNPGFVELIREFSSAFRLSRLPESVDNSCMDVNGSTLPGGSAVVLSAILALSGAGSAVAVPSQEETSRNRRLIQGFDFEEQITSDWSHIFMQEPSLPPKGLFFEATGDSRIQHDGAMSLRLNLLGGSISYRTGPQIEIPTDPDARYLVRGWVRTEGLGHAGARIEARILDGE